LWCNGLRCICRRASERTRALIRAVLWRVMVPSVPVRAPTSPAPNGRMSFPSRDELIALAWPSRCHLALDHVLSLLA